MIYERTVVYRINADTPEDAMVKWAEDGPKVWEGGDVEVHHDSLLELADLLAGHGVLAEGENEDG